jgi:hypothetical protein
MEQHSMANGAAPRLGAYNRSHISIDGSKAVEAYQPRSRPVRPAQLRSDYPGHAQSLLTDLRTALDQAVAAMAADRILPGAEAGVYLEVETLADKALPPLDQRERDGIRVANLRVTETGAEVGTIYVPERSIQTLTERVSAYGERDLGNRARPHVEEFQPVERIRASNVMSFWNGRGEPPVDGLHWWEVWCFADRSERVVQAIPALSMDLHPEDLQFPDSRIVFAHGALAQVERLIANTSGGLMEIRLAEDTPSAILEARELGAQQPWLDDLVRRLQPPPENAPAVCVLDTGVAAAHPLIAPGLLMSAAVDEAWGTFDHADTGHGTQMCGLALHGDLFYPLQDERGLALTHGVESVKLLPPGGFPPTEPENYGLRTLDAVSVAEINGGHRRRAHCLAVSTHLHDPNRPSAWSSAVDLATSGAREGEDEDFAYQTPKRLFLVSAGNVRSGLTREETLEKHPIEDPAQSWNAITVGGYTARDRIDPPEDDATLLARANERSPYSRVSCALNWDTVPIKPEVVFEAGNIVMRGDDCDHGHDSVSLISTGKGFGRGRPLTHFWATSAATGLAGQFMGRLMAAEPDLWPETHRALMVHSAEWTQPMLNRLKKSYRKEVKIIAAREFGYGVPNISRALKSARNDVALIAQSTIQPFARNDEGVNIVFNEINYYDLMWPRSVLEQLENAEVRLKVTLSYFVEPNPGGRAATRDDTYRSFGLRFTLRRKTENDAQFRARINHLERAGGETPSEQDKGWILGSNAVRAGSLHCDVWRGPAVDLAARGQIAVYPVGGWWKRSKAKANDQGRYALVVSLDARGLDVDLHSAILANVPIEVSV